MAVATYTASVLFARRDDSSFNVLTDRAAQGATSLGNMVGVIDFPTMNMANKVITGITLVTTCTSQAGAGNGSEKTLRIKKSTKANPTTGTSDTGLSFVGDALGSIKGTNFYDASNISRVIDPASALFANLKAYLESGAHALVLYAADNVPSSGYSSNYLYLDGLKLVITYEEGLVYYGDGGQWKPGLIYFGTGGQWVQCTPHLGVNGKWEQCGG